MSRLDGRLDRSGPLADEAHSSKTMRTLLRHKGVQAVIPERADQIVNRARRDVKGSPPVSNDAAAYKRCNAVEHSFNVFKQWRGLTTRYDKLALSPAPVPRPARTRESVDDDHRGRPHSHAHSRNLA